MRQTILIALITISSAVCAQQDPLYSQYYNNPMLINPAFAGSNERLYAGVAYRTQWAGIEGAPTTFNLNSHIALMNNKVGVGIMAVQDQIGDIKNTQVGAVGAYRIKLSNTTFSFGMQVERHASLPTQMQCGYKIPIRFLRSTIPPSSIPGRVFYCKTKNIQ